MSDLITRLKGLTAPSREVDLDIAIALEIVPEEVAKYDPPEWWMEAHGVDPYTASLDATIELCGRVLPGWSWRVATCCVSDDAWLTPDFNDPVHGKRLMKEFGAVDWDPVSYWQDITDVDLRPSGRPAIALLIALLRAKEARDAE